MAKKGHIPWNKGKKLSAETCKKISDSKKGQKHTQETRNKISEYRKGKILSIESRKKLSRYHTGLKHSTETKEKIRQANIGKKLSEETRAKISQSNTGKTPSDETRLKLSKSRIGKKLSKETRAKISKTVSKISGGRNELLDTKYYVNVHKWIKKQKGEPNKCEKCGYYNESNLKVQWANKSQHYLYDINDWLRLCVSCHQKYDIEYKKAML